MGFSRIYFTVLHILWNEFILTQSPFGSMYTFCHIVLGTMDFTVRTCFALNVHREIVGAK